MWAGDYFGMGDVQNSPTPNSWAADPQNDVAIFHITIRPGGRMVLPKANRGGVNRSLYLVEGHGNGVRVDGRVLSERVCLEMDATADVIIELPSTDADGASNRNDDDGRQRTEFLLLQGRPIGEPVAQRGPFVMNTPSELQEAFADYRRTEFGGWPWPRNDMVFPKGRGRFALVDGVETRPPSTDGEKDEL